MSWGYENPLRRHKGLIFLFCQYFLESGTRQREVEGWESRETDGTKFGRDGTLASAVNTCLEARLHLRTATGGRQGRGASRAQLVKHTRLLLIALKQYKPESLLVGMTERCTLRVCAGHLHAPREAARVCRKVAVQAGFLFFFSFFF